MALIIMNAGSTSGPFGGFSPDIVFGVGGTSETAVVAANGVVDFDPSWNEGGDTIQILGNAGDYSVAVVGADIVITSAGGADIKIPIGPAGANVKFDDADARQITIKDGDVCLGDQVIEGPAEPVAPGSGGSGSGGEGDVFILETSRDIITGTDGDDLFDGDRAPNFLGEIANTLSTGDRLDGGAGNDLLLATIQDDSGLNTGPGAAVSPRTVDIETVVIKAESAASAFEGTGKGDREDYTVELDAGDMIGLDEIGSGPVFATDGSDASLIIYDLNTLTDSGDYVDRRNTEEVMIRMDHSGGASAVDYASDLIVLFDQDYLLCDSVAGGSQLFYELMDLDAAIALDPANPLDESPVTTIRFTLDGDLKSIEIGSDYDTYPELLAAVQAAIAGAGPEFANITADFGEDFTAFDTDNDPGGSADGRTIVLTNSGPEEFGVAGQVFDGETSANRDFHTQIYVDPPVDPDCKITSNIKLEKVGRGSDGGELVVGGMSGELYYNVWGGGSGAVRGVEQFNIAVLGDASQPSSLSGVRSTNNTLQCIIIEDEGDEEASLTIGNSNSYGDFDPSFYDDHNNGPRKMPIKIGSPYGEDSNPCDLSSEKNNGLKDVLVFDASKFDNDTAVYGHFSDEVVAKYLELSDDEPTTGDPVPHATVDNLGGDAVYTFGEGNNLLNMNISKTNLALFGTATREDFSFTANTNGGEDHVQIQIGNGWSFEDFEERGNGAVPRVQEWYHNHVLNQNLHINTGDDDDKVETWGSTAADIDLGSGDDVVFTDNSGGECGECSAETWAVHDGNATWVFNTHFEDEDVESEAGVVYDFEHAEDDIGNLASAVEGSVSKVANVGLTVTFQGITSNVAAVGNTVGSLEGETITDLDINQAIKAAINEHPVLSEVLVAEDGPSRTLVVRSLIDGNHSDVDVDIDEDGVATVTAGDLVITLVSTGALSAQQVNQGALGLGDLAPGSLAAIGFNDDGSALTIPITNASDEIVYQPRYDSDFADCDYYNGPHFELSGEDSFNVNNNVVEGGLGDDVIVLSSNGVGYFYGASVETLDINGLFGDDVVFNFTAADGEMAIDEVQCIAVSEMIPAGSATGSGTGSIEINFAYDGLGDGPDIVVSVTWDETTTAQDIALDIEAQINAHGSVSSYVTASIDPTDDTKVIVTYDGPNSTPGANIDELVIESITGFSMTPVAEVQTITFTNDQVVDGTLTVDIAGETFGPIDVGDTDAVTPEEIVAAIVALGPMGDITPSDGGSGVLVLTDTVGGVDHADAVVTVSSSDVAVDSTVEETTQGGNVQDVAAVPDTVVDGSDPENGFDIFDVDDVIGPVSFATNFWNDKQDDNNEASVLQTPATFDLGAQNIVLIDTLENNDYAFSAPGLSEEQRIEEILNDVDDGSDPASMSLVITVDADNIGTFYKVTNGAGSGDVSVARQGSVELAVYVDDSKEPIGNWDMMSLSNFVPLSPGQLVDTFVV